MAKRALSWSRAAAIGWRDLKSAPGKFGFVVLSVAVGVAALVGVRGFSESFRGTLSTEARSLMAGDLTARIFRQPKPEEIAKIAAIDKEGIRSTWVTETVSMASAPPDPVPLLVSLKAVDPAEYPYYGKAELEPDMPLQQALAGDSAVVADEFLIRLKAQVGDTLRLGGKSFRISAVLKQEPDRISAGAGLGPRVMISRASLERPACWRRAAAPRQRLLLKLPDKLPPGLTTVTLRKQVEQALPDAEVIDFREGNPGADARPRQRHGHSEPHLPGGHGAGRYRRGHGHARAPGAAHGHAGNSQGRGRGIGRPAADFSACKRSAWAWPEACLAWPPA